MGQITHPTLGSPMAMVTPWAELIITGSRGMDKATYAQNIITYPHHELHGGRSYTYQTFTTLNSGLEFNFGLTTPNTTRWVHMVYQLQGTDETQLSVYEGATLSGGTAVTGVNRNRNSTNTSDCTFCALDPVISGASPTSGTLLLTQSMGKTTNPANTLGGETRGTQELVLKSGTTYFFVGKSAANGNIMTGLLDWYEHTDKIQQF